MDQCLAIKQSDGQQCTRTKGAGQKLYCTQHSKSKTKITSVKAVEPWTLLRLPVPDERNGLRFIQRIRTHLNKTHPYSKENPHKGYIYIFFLPEEKKNKGPSFWKIGYTERSVKERMDEWSEKHNLEVHSEYEIPYNVQKTEALIHLYLAYCRVYRYPTDQGFHSVYKLSGEVIEKGGLDRAPATRKEIEWFYAPIEEILKYVEPIVNKKK